MKREYLYSAVSKECGLTKRKARETVDAIFETIKRGVVNDKRVVIKGFGVWEKRELRAMVGRKPKTGESVNVPPRSRPWFRPSIELKGLVNDG